MENYKNTFGLDIGIGSVGSAVSDGDNILYMGTHVFNPANEASESRTNRSARRNLARKKWRKKQLVEAFNDFGIISKDETTKPGYLCFTTNNKEFAKPTDRTVYHLRKRALNEQVTEREVLLCLYNMLHARGHFLLETIDFTKDTISFDEYKSKFYGTINGYIEISENVKKEFEDEILEKVFSKRLKSNEIKTLFKNRKFILDDEIVEQLKELILLICSYKVTVSKISPDIEFKSDKCNITLLKTTSDEIPEFLSNAVELYDLANIHQILESHNYLCEVAVEKIDKYDEVVNTYGINSNEYKELAKEISGKSAPNAKHNRIVRNSDNTYPNGLYVKECRDILRKQQEYNKNISDEFIEVCESIIAARIPYFVGPLKDDAKNAWVVKNEKIKYSYDYAMKHGDPIDLAKTIKKWKERMISRCTYLPDQFALPKGSFLAETYNIVNELNILQAIDKNNDYYYLTREDKVLIFDTLFLHGGKIKFSDVKDVLDLSSYGPKNSNAKYFNNSYSLYTDIVKYIPELTLTSIEEIFSNEEKINKIEDIILNLNLYNEEKTKIDYFVGEGYSKDIAIKLSKLKSNSYYSYSKKFIYEQSMDGKGSSLLKLLFDDNTSKYTNEQMTLITNAVDENGVALDFTANKYINKIKENNNNLDINLLIEDGKPIIPISRPVIRALNETLKVYTQLVKTYGVPKRVIIETTRSLLNDHKQKPKFYDKTKSLYDHLIEQLHENKEYEKYSKVESWEEIEKYVTTNKTKVELYITQNGWDLLTGEAIDINHLEDYEVDHILPRGFGDDSMNDKMLISRLANQRKGNRLPLEFIDSGENIGQYKVTTSSFIKRVQTLYDMNLISEEKKNRLLLENSNELSKFINQNLVDTSYIIREFISIINAYNTVNNYDTHVVAMKSAYTNLYRKVFNMDKVRDFGDQHHAHDAALLVVADKTLSTYYPHYDERKILTKENDTFKTYNEFIKQMVSDDKDKKDDLKPFILGAFRKAYGISYASKDSIVSQIKRITPYYSTKAEKNHTGKFFDVTIYPQNTPTNPVLTILGVNNDKHVFNGIECVAVDFYKVPVVKGKGITKEHIAIHIPKVIIDKNGNINKDKYIKLIKYHYKKDILLDENGELKTYYFRFRAFKNDIIYSTATKCPMLFNIGSIADRRIRFKFFNVFSYDDIYNQGKIIANSLIDEFKLKTKSNKEGKNFTDYDNNAYVNYVATFIWKISLDDPRIKTVKENVKNDKNLFELSNHLAYLGLIIDRPGTQSNIIDDFRFVANSKQVMKDVDDYYIKLKYNILGLKFVNNDKGKLIIQSPKEIQGAFSKISKEDFSWKIGKDMVL